MRGRADAGRASIGAAGAAAASTGRRSTRLDSDRLQPSAAVTRTTQTSPLRCVMDNLLSNTRVDAFLIDPGSLASSYRHAVDRLERSGFATSLWERSLDVWSGDQA